MLSLLCSVYYYCLHLLLDFVLYILVDIAVKTCLREASNEQEKRLIWLWESAVLFALCVLVYAWHHTPWLLSVLSLLTLLYTQLLGRINFRYWWWQLATRWDEFEQHEESMEVYNSRNINPPNVSVQPGQPPFTQWVPMMPQQTDAAPAEPWYPNDNSSAQKQQPIRVYVPRNASNDVRFRGGTAEGSPYTPVMPRGHELTRKPIHEQSNGGLSSKLKLSFMNAIGMGPGSAVPPGLQNSGQNLCFMNSVLQCLSHSPCLASSFADNVQTAVSISGSQRHLVSAFSDILNELNTNPASWPSKKLSLSELRKAAAENNSSLVVDPSSGQKQGQEDAAEFLMWLLDALHLALNGACQQQDTGRDDSAPSSFSRPKFAAWTLRMLKYIYGDLTPQRIQELKVSCRHEIESANGLDNASYAEPIQRLSDLEWLTYKERNVSVLDDLFTGQLVEAQHCTACNRISVAIQTFTILPVSIVTPRQLSGIVHLDDCFAMFGTVEELFGADGLHCDGCNRSFSDNQTTPVTRHLGRSNGLVMSPIATNTSDIGHDASSLHESLFKTSTPIRGVPLKVTDGQRRCLLRQLPECLIIQLMRFTFHQGQPRKVMRAVNIPLMNLDLTSLIIDNVMNREDLTALHACFRYDLYGVVIHLGGESTGYGHYIAYTRAQNNSWYKFDDDRVTSVNMQYELNTKQVRENAYLLFYRKSVSSP